MHIDLEEDKLNLYKKLKKFNKLYDYIIIGSGPAASVILNNLIKTKKKVLVVERGDFRKKISEKLISKNFKIKKDSRVFGVGGTSNTWAQIYSLFSKNEMCNNKNINIWPLSHKNLTNWCKKVGPKYKFNIDRLEKQTIYKKNFYSRNFICPKNPLKFSKFYKKLSFDMITNCKVQSLDEHKDENKIFFNIENNIFSLSSKKIIICAGAIESSCLILNSIKDKKLKKIKNKKFIGRYFMDHPKCYVGELKFPKIKFIQKLILRYKKSFYTYKGLSLFKKNYRTLNTYVRFEEKKSFFKIRNKILIRVFLEMEPKFKNKIYLKKNTAHVNLSISKKEIEITKKLINQIKIFFSFKPKLEKLSFNSSDLNDASHHMGGLCYPKNVDKNLRVLGLKNIFCCSSAIFPTSGSANPTLIICALAERLSKFLQ
jgi:hypothetical protein